METALSVLSWLMQYGPDLLTAIIGLLTAAIGVSMLIPGEQPEKALQGIVNFLSKFSRKPAQVEEKKE